MLVTGGTLIDVDGERVADVRVGTDGRIAEVGPAARPARRARRSYDATGRYVIPGGIDAHTHLHLPVGRGRG